MSQLHLTHRSETSRTGNTGRGRQQQQQQQRRSRCCCVPDHIRIVEMTEAFAWNVSLARGEQSHKPGKMSSTCGVSALRYGYEYSQTSSRTSVCETRRLRPRRHLERWRRRQKRLTTIDCHVHCIDFMISISSINATLLDIPPTRRIRP